MRSQEDYEEWISTTFRIYSQMPHLVDAVWNQIWEDAKRDGYVEHLEENEDDVCDIIEDMIRSAR